MNIIKSYLFLIFSKRFDLIALNPFCFRSFIDFGFMSTGVIFFLSINFGAVSERMPEAVPISSIVVEDVEVDRYFFRKSWKKYESSAGW